MKHTKPARMIRLVLGLGLAVITLDLPPSATERSRMPVLPAGPAGGEPPTPDGRTRSLVKVD
jgi:hypothetical protein